MIRTFDRLSLPLLRGLPAELAHSLAIRSLALLPLPPACADDARLAVRAFGLDFPNPVGMAAGFDKNAEAGAALLRLGFGFAEVGTVTPKPQPGNPRPRLFRLPADGAIINRMGFNNDGAARVLQRLSARPAQGIIGVNIGANKDAPDRIADYVSLIRTFAPVARYFTVNISSPNTPDLRRLQQSALLDELLARVIEARDQLGTTPVLLKIAPDLTLAELDDITRVARSRRIDGMVISNTTIARSPALRDRHASEEGGLSGRPLSDLANRTLAETFVRVEGAFPLIGVGGINCGVCALTRIRCGASLVQLYSALVYRGLGLVGDIKRHLVNKLAQSGTALSDIVGVDAAALTAEPWPQL
ncbi:MAG: quinone-dependent dihydroorotate dehydrogenase [Alphaproteobacteria bacterium]|nr:quinone-dependent dihydroorotate dehydrogenase [Alphaproteobacteria bacterium]